MEEKLKVARISPEMLDWMMRTLDAPQPIKVGNTWFVIASDLERFNASTSAKRENS